MSLPIKKNSLNINLLTSKSKPDNVYLSGIRSNDTKVLNQIYAKFLPSITKFVLENSGTKDEALDVFQDGLVIIFKKMKDEEFSITSSFHTYFFAVCRFVWLNQLKKKKLREGSSLMNDDLFIADIDIEKEYIASEKQKFFETKLEELPIESRKVLRMSFNKQSLKQIAEAMGYTEAYAKRKKYKAKLQLIKAIKADAQFESLR